MYTGNGHSDIAKFIRSEFTDEDKVLDGMNHIMREVFPASEDGQELIDKLGSELAHTYFVWLRNTALENVKTIFSCAESPIEQIFFNTLNTSAMGVGQVLFFVPPMTITEEINAFSAERARRAKRILQWYSDVVDDQTLDFVSWATKTGDYTEGYLSYLRIMENDTWFNTRYVCMQATFPDIIPSPTSIRVDAFVFTQDMSTKIIVECDGFKFHKEHSSFIRDRQRDRFFKVKGYEVIRFAGSEINVDPVESVEQMLKQIFNN